MMENLTIRRGENPRTPEAGCSDGYLFLPGDIVAVNPGTDNNLPSGDKWWLLQINKALSKSKITFVYGFTSRPFILNS